ncbi:RNA-guided endonuclease InsQ/TnpB family protein [Streptomyces sp. R35]|uniref:RNA-guided endonuclease InsQ/TnpB family protein n=1 Tax=Streptomyces sp. R35 TaxID=3238630 RepID=A0AB39S1S7_9ACTN
MELRYTFRLEPGAGARAALSRTFGCARVVWNDALAVRRATHERGLPFPKTGDLSKLLITQAKRTEERAWLAGVSAVPLQQSLRDQDKAITAAGRLSLPKIGEIPVRWSRRLPSIPSSVTVIKDAAGRYFASFKVTTDPDTDRAAAPDAEGDLGIDLGLTHFAVLSDGSRVASPRFLRRAEKKLKKKQRELDRKQKGSKNQGKARAKVARAHAAVADARQDFHHQLSTKLIRENQSVSVETLSVKALARGRLAKSVHDAGWGQFLAMLGYKAKRYGRELTRVARNFPSSQLCSSCGHLDGPKPLAIRLWTCSACGTTQDRDWNAAKNTQDEGRRIRAAQPEAPPTPGPGALTAA